MKEIKLINRFSEKILNWANWTILGPKMAQPHNSGSTGRIFLKFCTMKGADRYMRIILVIVQKNCLGKMDYLGSKYRTSLELWILCKNFF